jgi:hypothetical protein
LQALPDGPEIHRALRHKDPNPPSRTLFDAPAGIGWGETDEVESVPGGQERRARHLLETGTAAHLIHKKFLNDYAYLGLKGLVLRGNCNLTHPDRAI